MPVGLKVTTLNVEGHKHLEKICDFLRAEKPQVLCLQEVFKVDLLQLAACLGEAVTIHFVPTLIVDRPNDFKFAPLGEYGIAILSSLPLKNLGSTYYVGKAETIPLINDRDPNNPNRALAWVDLVTDDGLMRIANTHFTWSPNGAVCEAQTESLKVLLTQYHGQIKTGLLCGDFNAPRGGEIYHILAQNFTDNVPQEITTTLDSEYHRIPGLEYVVDYVFTSPEYVVSDVARHSGLSDHQALSVRLRLL